MSPADARLHGATRHTHPCTLRLSPRRARSGTVNLIGSGRDKTHEGGSHEGTVNLMEYGRNDARDKAGDTDGYAVAATPVTSAQV
jgi:hypothetical protein